MDDFFNSLNRHIFPIYVIGLGMTQQEVLVKLQQNYPGSLVKVLSDDNVHFEVYIESNKFAGLTRVEQHQQVMKVFDTELKSGELHALAIKTKAI